MIPNAAPWLVILVGVVIGVLVGLVGTSGAFLIPTMVYVFGLSQLRAQGTSLFVALLPIWVLPLWSYARAGNVQWKLGMLLACGMAFGALFGGRWAQYLPDSMLRKGFAVVLAGLALKMFVQR